MQQLKTADDWGFLLSFIGGIIIVVNAIVGMIFALSNTTTNFFIGGSSFLGLIGETWGIILGTIITLVFGIICILIGMKLFSKKIWHSITKIDLIITAIILIVIGIICFGPGGLLVIIGGILCIIYRVSPAGERNPTGK
jgi:hypothetical protein